MGNTPTIRLNLSRMFHNKNNLTGSAKAFGDSFTPASVIVADLAEHMLDGKAWTAAAFEGNSRRTETFVSAQLIAVDFDDNVSVANALAIPFVRQFAAIVHPSASSGKVTDKNPTGGYRTRAVFVLSEPVERAERWRAIAKAVCRHIGLDADEASYKPAQPWYGSDNRIEEPYVNIEAVLPLALAGALTADDARREYEAERRRAETPMIKPTGDRAERYAAAALANELTRLATAPAGTRNKTTYSVAYSLFSKALGDWPGIDHSSVQRELEAIVSAWPNARKSLSTIARARKDATPKALELPAEQRERPRRAPYAPEPAPAETGADRIIHVRYVTIPTDTPARCLALQSGVGTGKTQAAIQAAASAGRVLYLTHRELLAENFSRNALRAGVAIEHYKELNATDQRRAPKLAVCIPTYARLADGKGGKLPTADLLILDEFDQLLQFVYGDTDLFEGDDAIRAAEALKFAIRSAGRVLALDAHLSDLALDYLRSIRGADDVLFVRNTYQAERGPLTLHDKRESAIDAGLHLVAENAGTVAFACASAKRALDLATQAITITGDAESVLCVTRENADGERQRAFLKDPNGEIGKYRALIYSPIIGTGYDITTPVRAIVGIMATFQTAEDARQMLGRCRNAQEAHVWLPDTSASRVEDADAIFQAGIDNAKKTHFAISEDGSAVADIAPALKSFHKMHSLIMARRNNSTNNLRGRFVALSAGYTLDTCEAESPTLRETMRAIAEARTERLKALALELPAIDAETYRRAYEAGQVTDDIEAAARRGQIEGVTGLTISPALRDRLWSSRQRQQLRAFTDLLDDFAELKLFDTEEAAAGKPLHARAHKVVRRRVRNAFINALMTPAGETPEYSRGELEQALAPLIAEHAVSLRGLFGWRPDQCRTAAGVARRVLESVGLKLASSQRMTDGQRERYYQLDGEALADMRALAEKRLAMLARKRAEERDESLLKTHKKASIQANVDFKQPAAFTPIRLTDTAKPYVFDTRRAAGLPVNPFARATS